MSAIKGKNTKAELYIRKQLFRFGYRYRVNVHHIIGTPDIWLKKYNTAIFINGCFWHRHDNCKFAYFPKSNIQFWDQKFQNNMRRDEVVKKELLANGIKQLVIWECTVKKMQKDPAFNDGILDSIVLFLTSDKQYLEL